MKDIQTFCFVCGGTHSLFGKCPNQVMPSWNPPPVLPTTNVRQQMHADLAKLLDAIWTQKGAIHSYSYNFV